VQKLNAAMIVGLILLLGVIVFAIRAYRNKKNFALTLAYQKEIVEEKNREVTASINYAKRIQMAILPPDELLKKHLKDYFLLYKPKDIVAGDFYWLEPFAEAADSEGANESGVLFAVADCTGHGVPGAMVSVVCANALNKGVIEENISQPAALLDRTREHVLESFRRSNEDIKDGMDIALCSLRVQEQDVEGHCAARNYAGANNPLWIVSKNSHIEVNMEKMEPLISHNSFNLFEIKADKQPIGLYGKEQAFSNHRIELNEGDQLYLFSDGFADQFGGKGEKAKKFKASNFKRLILETSNMSAKDQGKSLELALNEWMGDYEQLDDVCVIGVRI
jgi:serine phosphatase RsbU (regulator of sigma subunit)